MVEHTLNPSSKSGGALCYQTTKKLLSCKWLKWDIFKLCYQDEECRLLQVGSWSAMTGYALAFPHHSKFKHNFNAKILELRENGNVEIIVKNLIIMYLLMNFKIHYCPKLRKIFLYCLVKILIFYYKEKISHAAKNH